MRTNLTIAIIVVAICALAVVLPLELMSHDDKTQTLAQTGAPASDGSAPSSPHHDMAAMMMGQEDQASSGQSNETQDSDMQNTPQSKTSGNVTVSFAADPVIQTNHLA